MSEGTAGSRQSWERVKEGPSPGRVSGVVPCVKCGSSEPCFMCMGTKVYPYRVNPPFIKWGRCGACIDGLEHDYAGGAHE